jgi:hypothetical protein
MRTLALIILMALVAALVLSQLQPLLIKSLGGVAGSFGARPISHRCLGLMLEAPGPADSLPLGDVEFRLGLFHFRYSVSEEDLLLGRPICVGQDLWYGE